MSKINTIIENEQGFVLITSLLMLMVLLLIGIAATNTTTIELQISGNDKLAKQNFYEAESTVYEGSWVLKKLKRELESGETSTFVQKTTASRQVDRTAFISAQQGELNSGIRDRSTWVEEGATGENSADGTLPNTSYRAVDLGASNGASLSLNSPTGSVIHKYVVIGRYRNTSGGRKGEAMVELGLRIK